MGSLRDRNHHPKARDAKQGSEKETNPLHYVTVAPTTPKRILSVI